MIRMDWPALGFELFLGLTVAAGLYRLAVWVRGKD
jgi:hypothetical protein